MTDPISDMFSRIRNAALVYKNQVEMPHSKVKEAVAKVLVKSGYLEQAKVMQSTGRKRLVIEINDISSQPTITQIRRISRPGRRVYVQAKEIPVVKRGRGIVVVSTSQGIMSGSEASAKGLGGELVCEVY